MLAKEIHEDSLKKKTAFSACDVSRRSFPCPAGIVARVRHQRTIVRGGSRVTRGKRSVFLERYLTSSLQILCQKQQFFSMDEVKPPIYLIRRIGGFTCCT